MKSWKRNEDAEVINTRYTARTQRGFYYAAVLPVMRM